MISSGTHKWWSCNAPRCPWRRGPTRPSWRGLSSWSGGRIVRLLGNPTNQRGNLEGLVSVMAACSSLPVLQGTGRRWRCCWAGARTSTRPTWTGWRPYTRYTTWYFQELVGDSFIKDTALKGVAVKIVKIEGARDKFWDKCSAQYWSWVGKKRLKVKSCYCLSWQMRDRLQIANNKPLVGILNKHINWCSWWWWW